MYPLHLACKQTLYELRNQKLDKLINTFFTRYQSYAHIEATMVFEPLLLI